jgi:NADH-quinone oxidoreductase subunit M
VVLLTVLQKVYNGPLAEKWGGFPDLSATECWVLAPALILMLVLGVYPQLILGFIHSTVSQMLQQMRF